MVEFEASFIVLIGRERMLVLCLTFQSISV